MMTAQQAAYLVEVARRAVYNEIARGTEALDSPQRDAAMGLGVPEGLPPWPDKFGGVFVTLRSAGRLRGCMGTFAPTASLIETVADVARKSCRDDPRFKANRLRADEVAGLQIDVSVLGSLRAADDPSSLVVGRDGILIRRGRASGCLLPQVAVERKWGAEEFLSRCCQEKAGLDANAWREPSTEVFLFSAEVASSTAG